MEKAVPSSPVTRKSTGILTGSIPSEVSRRGLSFQEAQKTLEDFHAACVSAASTDVSLDALANRLQDAGYRHEMTDVLAKALGSNQAHPHVGALWIRRLVSSKGWDRKYPTYIDELVERGEIGRRAVLEFLRYLNTKSKPKLTSRVVGRHGRWLKKDNDAWPLAAGALAKAGLYRQAVRWTAGSEAREDTPGRVLQARALAFRGLGREKRASEVIELALRNPDDGTDVPLLLLWKATEEALAGNTSSAGALFRQIQPTGWDDETMCHYYLVRGLIRVQESPAETRREAFYSSFARIQDRLGRRRISRRPVMLRRTYRRCVAKMSRDAGQWLRALVVPWHSADTPWMLIPLLLVPGLQLFLPLYLYRLLTRR